MSAPWSTAGAAGAAVVPIKALARAKSRLGLGGAARAAVVAYMARHVIGCLVRCPRIERVWVIAGDDEAAALARSLGATPVAERGARLGEMIDAALRELTAPWALVVMADLPWLTAGDVDQLIDRLAAHAAVIAGDEDGVGTNALAVRLPVDWPTAFGGGPSFAAHLDRAGRVGGDAAVVRSPTIAFDVDLPAHLKRAIDHDIQLAVALGGSGGE